MDSRGRHIATDLDALTMKRVVADMWRAIEDGQRTYDIRKALETDEEPEGPPPHIVRSDAYEAVVARLEAKVAEQKEEICRLHKERLDLQDMTGRQALLIAALKRKAAESDGSEG